MEITKKIFTFTKENLPIRPRSETMFLWDEFLSTSKNFVIEAYSFGEAVDIFLLAYYRFVEGRAIKNYENTDRAN